LAAAVLAAGTAAFSAAADERGPAVDDAQRIAEASDRTDLLNRLRSEAGDWLLKHPEARYRAAGLLHAAGDEPGIESNDRDPESKHGEQESVADSLANRFERTIRDARSGAALAWLAHACSEAGLESDCIDAGLDQAIVGRDGANLFSRLALLPNPQADRLTALILDAHTAGTYPISRVDVWFDALSAVDTQSRLEPHERLLGAFGQVMASTPSVYQPLADACGADIADGSELEAACNRLLAGMAERGESALERNVAIGILERRARAQGHGERAQRLAAEQRQIQQLGQCSGQEIEPLLEAGGAEAVSEFLATIVEHGELEGQQRFAAAHGIDCPDTDTELTFVDPLLTDKLGEIERTLDRLWPLAGQWRLDSMA
jgi:hypothetical protein